MRGVRNAYVLLAVVAWAGVLLGLVITLADLYPSNLTNATLIGGPGSVGQGFLGRLIDYLSYFTHWANIVAAVVATSLARDPGRRGRVFDVLALDALVMIAVTGLVYNLLLAPVAPPQRGLEAPSNLLQHVITPLLAIIVFAIWGPFRRWTWRTPFAALLIPLAYAAWTLVHGAVVTAYPYGILNVADYGYAAVLTTLAEIVVLGIVLGYAFLGIDRLRSRRA